MKQRVNAVEGLSGVRRDGACRKRTMGTERPFPAQGKPETDRGIHNPWPVPGRESDGLIVAKKAG